jgi:ABC-type sugar transport system substrate-binding protein
MGEGAYMAMKQKGLNVGKDIFVCSAADGQQSTLSLIKAGAYLATGYNCPDWIGNPPLS